MIEKQSGSKNSKIISDLKLNEQLKVIAKFPALLKEENKTIEFSAELTTDQFYGVALANQ
jgi:hypothetical protein